jgi:hypothetical protein
MKKKQPELFIRKGLEDEKEGPGTKCTFVENKREHGDSVT